MATLDILIPYYNDPEGLVTSLRSVVSQSWEGDKRVVVVDDGSSLDAKRAVQAIVSDFRQGDSAQSQLTIDLLHNEVNRGRPYTRNVLLDSIDSRYVAWLDAG